MKEILNHPYSINHADTRRMDIFVPESNSNGVCILFIHGGGWGGGNRTQWHPLTRHFCQLGYTCVSAGYRLAPENRFPSQIEDVRLAMSYLKENASNYQFDPQKVAAMGSSAGGHLVLMLTTTAPEDRLGYSDEMHVSDTRPCLAVCYCPVTTVHLYKDLWKGCPAMPEFVPKFMGTTEETDPELFRQASPIDRIRGGEPPVLFVHGDADTSVPLIQSVVARDKIKHFGGNAELVVLPGVKHGFGYGIETQAQKDAVKHTEAFLLKYFIKQGID